MNEMTPPFTINLDAVKDAIYRYPGRGLRTSLVAAGLDPDVLERAMRSDPVIASAVQYWLADREEERDD